MMLTRKWKVLKPPGLFSTKIRDLCCAERATEPPSAPTPQASKVRLYNPSEDIVAVPSGRRPTRTGPLSFYFTVLNLRACITFLIPLRLRLRLKLNHYDITDHLALLYRALQQSLFIVIMTFTNISCGTKPRSYFSHIIISRIAV